MNHVYVRPLRLYDQADKDAFIAAVEKSGKFFPANVFTLPSTRFMVAEVMEDGKPKIVGYQPQYLSLVLGSFVRIGNDREVASALHMLTADAYSRANSEGYADVVMFSVTPETVRFAARHGFEETHTGYRLGVR